MALSTMASASTGVMNSLLGKLATLMGDEYRKLKGVRNKVASLRDEFNSMNALLVKLAGMDELDAQAKVWRDQVREMSYDVEDCIDDFMHGLAEKGVGTGFLKKAGERLKKLRVRHQIANKIQGIETRVSQVHERRMRYKLDEYTASSSIVTVDPRALAIYAEASCLVGIDAPRDELVKLLMGAERELKVASIVGFGGLGKTTLANEVYREIQGQFDSHAFVSVSLKPDMPSLLSNLLLKLGGQHSFHTSKSDDVINSIREHLLDKRYFIAIDDLWDSSAWNIIRCAFPENNLGSRVLTTTRIQSVAVACCHNSKKFVYKMKSLNDQDSRRLFFGRIFGSGESCPDVFEEASTDILKRCGGLPLAIISVSSLLADQSRSTWEYVRKSLGSMFEGNPTLEQMKQILDLSYRNLPHHLKTCLLYIGMYPEDHEINKDDLLRQWIAEGFVGLIHGLDADDVAGSYFNELINRSMIQPVKKDYNDEVLSCRVHDIMLDLIRSKIAEENFITVMDDQQVVTGAYNQIRRVSLHYGGEEDCVIPSTINESISRARSVAVFRSVPWPRVVEFKYVRVLHLEIEKRYSMDLTGMCRLFLLRYLKVSRGINSLALELPSHIRELRQLETLDLERVTKVSIPSDIVSLPRLLHLLVPGSTVLPDGIGSLKSLRTLLSFNLSSNSIDNIKCLGELTNIRDLRLSSEGLVDKESRMDALRSSLERLSHSASLKSFALKNYSFQWLDGWSTLSPSPCHLRKLDLSGCTFLRVPNWIAQLRDLYSVELEFEEVVSKDDVLSILAELPSLVHLGLSIRIYSEERVIISGSSMAFRALKHLKFSRPKPLLAFEEGAMPKLQMLELSFCLKDCVQGSSSVCLPVGIENLPAGLKNIHLWRMDYAGNKGDIAAAKSAFRSAFGASHSGADLIFAGTRWGYFDNDEVDDEAAMNGEDSS